MNINRHLVRLVSSLVPLLAIGLMVVLAGGLSAGAESATVADCHVPGAAFGNSSGEIVTFDAGNRTVAAVCIKSGAKMFVTVAPDGTTSSGHSGPLTNGLYESGCYEVTGVGTSFVTITRHDSPGAQCQGINHVDVLFSEPPAATATATQQPPTATPVTPTATSTPAPSPTSTPSPSPTRTPGPTNTPTNTPEPPTLPQEIEPPANTPTPTTTPTRTPTPRVPDPTQRPDPPATATPFSAVAGQASTPAPRTPLPTATPTSSPTASPTATPTRTPTRTATLVRQGPPPPLDGFTRVTLPPGTGYIFAIPGFSPTGSDIFWDGTRLFGGDGVRFAEPFPGNASDAGGDALAAGYTLSSITPQPGTVVHLSVTTASGTSYYALWIPTGQELGRGLTFDWRATAPVDVATEGPLPSALQSVSLAADFFQGGADVAATNLLLTLGVLLLLLGGGALFNESLEENVRGWGVRSLHLPGPLNSGTSAAARAWSRVADFWAAAIPGKTWMDRAIGPTALLLGTGFIYSLLEPNFGWNERSLTLFISLVVSQGVLVAMYEGGKAWLYRRALRVDAGLRLFPGCIAIALVSVAISRSAGFQPGFVVGFIAAAVVIGKPDFTAEERGRAWAIVASAMLVVSIAAWLVAIPLHDLYKSSPSLWTALPAAIAVSTFVVCLEGLLFNLIPLEFMDGWRIWKWSPIAWFGLFVPAAFLFTQIVFNHEEAYAELIASQKSVAGLIMLVAYLGATFGTWVFFKVRADRRSATATAGTDAGS